MKTAQQLIAEASARDQCRGWLEASWYLGTCTADGAALPDVGRDMRLIVIRARERFGAEVVASVQKEFGLLGMGDPCH